MQITTIQEPREDLLFQRVGEMAICLEFMVIGNDRLHLSNLIWTVVFLPADSAEEPETRLAALDPVSCAGGTTTVQALWMGAPVVTLTGENFCGRLIASSTIILNSVI